MTNRIGEINESKYKELNMEVESKNYEQAKNALMSACEKLADFIFVEGLDND